MILSLLNCSFNIAFGSPTRLTNNGYLIKFENKNEIDHPFFSHWISQHRNKYCFLRLL